MIRHLRRAFWALALAGLVAGPAAGQGSERRMLDDLEAVGFRGVGRLELGRGRRFCTAALISDILVLTAAHCLYDPATGRRVGADEIRFAAGRRRDTAVAVRAVTRTAHLPGFDFGDRADLREVRHDLALVELATPVTGTAALPLRVGQAPRGPVAIVSYARDRPWVASIQEVCPVRASLAGVAVLGCGVEFGASGAPVVAVVDGRLRLVAVVSAMGRDLVGAPVALSVLAGRRLRELRAELARETRR